MRLRTSCDLWPSDFHFPAFTTQYLLHLHMLSAINNHAARSFAFRKRISLPLRSTPSLWQREGNNPARENLKLLVDRVNGLFEKAEAVDGGSEVGVQIVVIGLVVAVFRLAVKVRCERMNKACFIACVAERPHRWLMRRASHFDGDDTKLFRPDGLDTVNLKFKETL